MFLSLFSRSPVPTRPEPPKPRVVGDALAEAMADFSFTPEKDLSEKKKALKSFDFLIYTLDNTSRIPQELGSIFLSTANEFTRRYNIKPDELGDMKNLLPLYKRRNSFLDTFSPHSKIGTLAIKNEALIGAIVLKCKIEMMERPPISFTKNQLEVINLLGACVRLHSPNDMKYFVDSDVYDRCYAKLAGKLLSSSDKLASTDPELYDRLNPMINSLVPKYDLVSLRADI